MSAESPAATEPTSDDAELATMLAVYNLLQGFDTTARSRMPAWVNSRIDAPQPR